MQITFVQTEIELAIRAYAAEQGLTLSEDANINLASVRGGGITASIDLTGDLPATIANQPMTKLAGKKKSPLPFGKGKPVEKESEVQKDDPIDENPPEDAAEVVGETQEVIEEDGPVEDDTEIVEEEKPVAKKKAGLFSKKKPEVAGGEDVIEPEGDEPATTKDTLFSKKK